MPDRTRWGAVIALILAGVIVALQIGKAAIALPALQRELTLTLALASWIVGAYGLLGALAGLPAGIMSSLFRAKPTVLAGLATAGIGSIAGAWADSGTLLIATRVLEGCGFLAVTLAIPRLLRMVAALTDFNVVLPLFGSYLPLGSLTMMLAGPLLLSLGWQTLWIVNGVIALLWLPVIWCIRIDEPRTTGNATASLLPNMRAIFSTPGPILLALAFGTYTFQYMALTGLLPTLLVDRLGLSIAAAGTIGAIAVAANALGNMSAGGLLRLGVPTWAIAAGAFTFLGAAGFGIFSDAMPVAGVAALASLSLALTGMIPGSIYAAAPRFAPSSAALAIALGLINQVTNLGNLTGPAALAFTVDLFGWSRAPLFFAAVAAAGLAVALGLRGALRRTPPPTST
jgi:MFS family permease